MLKRIRKVLIYGKKFEFLKIKFHFYEKKIIGGGQLEKHDLVDQIQRFFTGFEIQNFHQKIQMLKAMKIIGWKFGIMFFWNL
jgi:hypothetical protein